MSNLSIKMPKRDSFFQFIRSRIRQNFIPDPTSRGKKFRIQHLRDGVDHVEPHLDGVPSVVAARIRQPRHAVVAVTQDLYTQAVVLLQTKRIINV